MANCTWVMLCLSWPTRSPTSSLATSYRFIYWSSAPRSSHVAFCCSSSASQLVVVGGFQKKTPSRTTLRFFFVRFKRDKNRDTCCESAQCVTMIHRGEWRPVSKRDVVPTRAVFSFHRNGLGELLQESTFIVTISFILSMSLVLCVTQLKICERCSGGIFFDQMKKRKI